MALIKGVQPDRSPTRIRRTVTHVSESGPQSATVIILHTFVRAIILWVTYCGIAQNYSLRHPDDEDILSIITYLFISQVSLPESRFVMGQVAVRGGLRGDYCSRSTSIECSMPNLAAHSVPKRGTHWMCFLRWTGRRKWPIRQVLDSVILRREWERFSVNIEFTETCCSKHNVHTEYNYHVAELIVGGVCLFTGWAVGRENINGGVAHEAYTDMAVWESGNRL